MTNPPHNVELEYAKILHKLIQDSKDEPKKLATKLYVILQHMRSTGKENSMPYQVISRAMETVIKQHELDIEALMSSRHPMAPSGAQLGESGSSQVVGSSPRAGGSKDPNTNLAGNELSKPDIYPSGMPHGGPSSGGHDLYPSGVPHGGPSSGGHDTPNTGGAGMVHGMTPSAASSYPLGEMGVSVPKHFTSSSYDNHGFAGKMLKEGIESFPSAAPSMDPYTSKTVAGGPLDHEGSNLLPNPNKPNQLDIEALMSSRHPMVPSGAQLGESGSSQVVGLEPFDDKAKSPRISSSDLSFSENLEFFDTVRKVFLNDDPPESNNVVELDWDSVNQTRVTTKPYIAEAKIDLQQTTTSSSKKVAVRKLDEEYGIGFNTLHQNSDKKLKDLALTLGVSRSTLKRICRKHGISRWPPRKTKAHKNIEDVSGDQRMECESVPNLLCLEKGLPCKTATLQDVGKMMVKVSYKDDIIKFEVSVSIPWLELEEKVAIRMKLSVGNFKLKYVDEDKELITIACEEDLRTCMNTSTTSRTSATIRMIVCQG